MSAAETIEVAESRLRLILAAFQQFSSTALNSFKHDISVNKASYLEKYKHRLFEKENSSILNIEELGTVYHLPSAESATPNISWVYSRKTEPPSTLPTKDKDIVQIGETVFRNHETRFGIREGDDRLRHMYVIGKSGNR